ncbi:MAG: ABC transporter permease [Geobacteraceae bacterium]
MKGYEGFQRASVVFRAELLHLVRDPISLGIALFMPMFLLFLIGYSVNMELRESAIAVYDLNKSQQSDEYIKTVDNTSFFEVRYRAHNYDELLDLLNKGVVKLAIIIPPKFSESLSKGEPAVLQTLVDASYINSALFILSYMEGINGAYSASIVNNFLQTRGHAFAAQPVRLSVRSWYNQGLRELTFKITGTFSIIILGFVPVLSALAIVREKESGSIQQVFASPITPYEYIAGKMAPYVIFLTLDYLFIMVFGIWFFDLPFRGLIPALFAATLLMVFSCVAIGFFISTISGNQLSAAMLAIVFTLMPALIYANAIAPLDNSPVGFKLYSNLFPGAFYTDVCRAILLKGTTMYEYLKAGASLIIYSIVIFLVCAWRVRNKNI